MNSYSGSYGYDKMIAAHNRPNFFKDCGHNLGLNREDNNLGSLDCFLVFGRSTYPECLPEIISPDFGQIRCRDLARF